MGSMMATEQTLSLAFEWQFSPVTTESMIHMAGMVLWLRWTRKLNKAAKWTIKKYRELANGKGIEELEIQTEEGTVTLDKDWKVIDSTDPGVPKWEDVFKEKDSPKWNKKEWEPQDFQENQNEELETRKQEIQRQKEELENKRGELEKRRDELLRQREENRRSLDGQENNIWKITDILKVGNIITIDWLKYKFIGMRNSKAEFVIDKTAKKSAEQLWKLFEEKVEVSSLDELADKSRFNLEPWEKNTNAWRYQKLQELINTKVEPLDRLKNKIKNKEWEIQWLEEEIARLEKWKNTIAHNDYFKDNKSKLQWRNVWIDWVKYKVEHVNKDWSLQFKEADGDNSFTISSFKQLAEKWDYINNNKWRKSES